MQSEVKFFVLVALTVAMTAGCLALEKPPEERSANSEDETAASAQPARHASVEEGRETFGAQCASCHRSGMAGAPDLTGITERIDRDSFIRTLDEGPGRMPSWSHLEGSKKRALWAFLGSPDAQNGAVAQTEGAGGCGGGAKGCGGGCGCGGGANAGGCGAVDRRERAKKPRGESDRPSGGGGCGCGR